MQINVRSLFVVPVVFVSVVAATMTPAAAQQPESRVLDAFAYDPQAQVEPKQGDSDATIAANNAAEAVKRGRDERGRLKTIELSGLLAVQVSNHEQLLGEGNENCSALRLELDGLVFTETVPYRCTHDLVIFNLGLIERSKEPAWEELIRKRRGVYAYTNISLRDAAGNSLPSDASDREIHLYNLMFGIPAVVALLGVLWGFFRLARRSNMLRDGGIKRRPNEPLRPYSLARSQAAWWFFLVLISFITISLLTGELAAIPGAVLGLMGISAGTFLGSELVDATRRDESDPSPVASPDRLGYFKDIFSDAGGVAFHRFQMFVWTVALGILFLVKVCRNLEFPEFDTSLLGLTAISSGTYLGMKIPETTKTGAKTKKEDNASDVDFGSEDAASDPDLAQ